MSTTEAESETTVGHCKSDSTDVYIGRGPDGRDMTETAIGNRGWLGNPFRLNDGYSRSESIELFEEQFSERLENDEEFRNAVADISGSTVGCWCRSVDEETPACHGDVVSRYADKIASEQ